MRTPVTVRSSRALHRALTVAALLLPSAAFAQGGASPAAPLQAAAFWGLATLTVGSAAMVAFSRSIVSSAFSLLGTFLGVAGLFVLLSADFLAVAQVLIYIGGVLVLILFAVMLTSRISEVKLSNEALGVVPAALVGAAVGGMLLFVGLKARWHTVPGAQGPETTADTLGRLFLNQYLLPFEIASVVLLATLIGAVVMARKEIKPD